MSAERVKSRAICVALSRNGSILFAAIVRDADCTPLNAKLRTNHDLGRNKRAIQRSLSRRLRYSGNSCSYVVEKGETTRCDYLRLVRQSVVVLGHRALFLAQLLADPADPLRRIPQCEALRVVTQVKLLPIEYLAHVAGVTRIETHPGDVRYREERLSCKIQRLSCRPSLVPAEDTSNTSQSYYIWQKEHATSCEINDFKLSNSSFIIITQICAAFNSKKKQ